jgi:hypothetical protein
MKYAYLLLFVIGSYSLFAQEKAAAHYLKFEVSVADTVLNRLDPGEPESRAAKEKLKSNKNHLYLSVREMIHDSLPLGLNAKHLEIRDNDTLSHYIKLGMEGFPLLSLSPKGPIKKLKKKGYQADLYLALDAKVDLAGFSISSKGIQPVVEIRLNAWDGDGNSLQKITHKEKLKKAILDKIDRDNEFIKYKNTEKAAGFSGKRVKFDKTQRAFIDLLLSELEPQIALAVQHTLAKWK